MKLSTIYTFIAICHGFPLGQALNSSKWGLLTVVLISFLGWMRVSSLQEQKERQTDLQRNWYQKIDLASRPVRRRPLGISEINRMLWKYDNQAGYGVREFADELNEELRS